MLNVHTNLKIGHFTRDSVFYVEYVHKIFVHNCDDNERIINKLCTLLKNEIYLHINIHNII